MVGMKRGILQIHAVRKSEYRERTMGYLSKSIGKDFS